MAQVYIGTVSAGTLRTEDLLYTFAPELLIQQNHKPSDLTNEAFRLLGMGVEWTDEQEEEAEEIVNELIDALNEYCPPFVYFGSHPGDGADFGFWPDIESIEEALRYAEDTDDDEVKYLPADGLSPADGLLVHVSDHGNILVMDMYRNELWSCV